MRIRACACWFATPAPRLVSCQAIERELAGLDLSILGAAAQQSHGPKPAAAYSAAPSFPGADSAHAGSHLHLSSAGNAYEASPFTQAPPPLPAHAGAPPTPAGATHAAAAGPAWAAGGGDQQQQGAAAQPQPGVAADRPAGASSLLQEMREQLRQSQQLAAASAPSLSSSAAGAGRQQQQQGDASLLLNPASSSEGGDGLYRTQNQGGAPIEASHGEPPSACGAGAWLPA